MIRPPSVALVSRSNALGGGASRIAEELAEWLRKTGSDVVHYCASPLGSLKPFQASLYSQGIAAQFTRFMHRLTRRLGLKELLPVEFYTSMFRIFEDFDVVHFHDLNTAISPKTLQLTSRRKPVVFTAHDCSCFTGGCIYPLQCVRYLKGCGRCPQLPAMGARFDFTAVNLRISRWLAREKQIQFVFPSKWLEEMASKCLNFGRRAEIIPNGFSSDSYGFLPRLEARLKLGIREERRVVLVAAHYLADTRKGVAFALTALQAVDDLAPLVIFVGIPPHDLEARLPSTCFWLTGFVSDRGRLGLLFAAADIFLFPSLEDNLPIMVQESLAAGTPVVGFAAGGVAEIVDHGRSGWLCPPGDQNTLNQNLRDALLRDDLAEFGCIGQRTMQDRFDIDTFGEKHLAIYKAMVN